MPVSVGQGVALGTNLLLLGGKMLGGGDHLPLTEEEEKDWGDAVDMVSKLAKGKQSKKIIKAVERAAPWMAFGWTATLIFGPRAMMTLQLVKERKAAEAERARQREEARHAPPPHREDRGEVEHDD